MPSTTTCTGTWREDFPLLLSPTNRDGYITDAARCTGCGERMVWVRGHRDPVKLDRFYAHFTAEEVTEYAATVVIGRDA